MKLKKVNAVLALVLTGTILLSGCGKTPVATGGNTPASDVTQQEEAAGNEATGEVTEFTIYQEDPNETVVKEGFQSEIAKEMTKQSGVFLHSIYGTGDVANQVTLMIADKAYPDFVFSRSNAGKFLEAGAFVDLVPLIDEYGPNIKKLYGDSYELMKDAEGHIYMLGQGWIHPESLEPAAAFELQHAAVIEAGYPQIRTLDDYKAVIANYVKNHPTTEDGQKTIGMSLIASDGWRWGITVGNPAGFASGFPDDGDFVVNPDTYDTVYKYTRDELKIYFRWLNGMYQDGLLDPDTFTQSYDTYIAKIASGRVVGLADGKWEYYWGGAELLEKDGKFDLAYGCYPVTLDEKTKFAINKPSVQIFTNGVGITDNCQDPVKAIQFMDYLCKEETQVLVNWGIEGIHWEIKDGKRAWTAEEFAARYEEEHSVKTGMGLYSYPWPCSGMMKDSQGYDMIPMSVEELVDKQSDVEKDVLAHYDATIWMDLFPPSSSMEVSKWGQVWLYSDSLPGDNEARMILDECRKITPEYLAKLATCDPSEFDATWDDFQAMLKKVEVDKMGGMITEMVKGYVDRVENATK